MRRQRTRRDERVVAPRPIQLQPRDLDIMEAVHSYQVLSTQHLRTLYFSSLHQAYARLAALYHHGFLDRRFLGVRADKNTTPILYVLDKRGAECLRKERGIDVSWSKRTKPVTTTFLEHTLAINTFRIAIAKACMSPGFSLLKWLGENELKADYDYVTLRSSTGRLRRVSVIPDSYFVLSTPKGIAHCFLELDRGTMTTQRFKTKIEAYQVYYASGAYERRFATKSLRVLTVTASEARAKNLYRVTEQAHGKQRYWFTTLSEVTPETVLRSPIWRVATNDAAHALV